MDRIGEGDDSSESEIDEAAFLKMRGTGDGDDQHMQEDVLGASANSSSSSSSSSAVAVKQGAVEDAGDQDGDAGDDDDWFF